MCKQPDILGDLYKHAAALRRGGGGGVISPYRFIRDEPLADLHFPDKYQRELQGKKTFKLRQTRFKVSSTGFKQRELIQH